MTAASVDTNRRERVTGTSFTRGLGAVTLVGIAWLVLFGLVVTPADVNQGESVRIMYAHVPGAWLAYLAFVVTAIPRLRFQISSSLQLATLAAVRGSRPKKLSRTNFPFSAL